MYQRVKMYVAVVLMATLFMLPLFLAVESSRNPSDAWYELPWVELMVMMVAAAIAAPIFVWIILRLIYWVYPGMAELVKGRNNPIEREKFLAWCVMIGLDAPRPQDLARVRVTAVAGRWIGKMPEEVYLTMEGRDGGPVRYKRCQDN